MIESIFWEKFCPKEKLLTNNAIAKNFDEVFIVSFFVGLKNYFDTKMWKKTSTGDRIKVFDLICSKKQVRFFTKKSTSNYKTLVFNFL